MVQFQLQKKLSFNTIDKIKEFESNLSDFEFMKKLGKYNYLDYSNLASYYHYKQKFDHALRNIEKAIE